MDVAELMVREAVRDLVAAYTWAGDRGRSAELAALFAEDGVLDVGDHGGRWVGRAEIERRIDSVAADIAATGGSPGPVHHHVASLHIEVGTIGDRPNATARSYFAVHTRIGLDHWGRYRDRFAVGAGGTWCFAERVVRVGGHAPGSLAVADRPASADPGSGLDPGPPAG